MGTVGALKKWRNENFSPNPGLKSQVVFLFTEFFNSPTVPIIALLKADQGQMVAF